MSESVLVALSGGIDSAVTAFLLQQEGYAVTGVNFNFFDPAGHGSRERLERVSEKLQIPVLYHDARDLFHKKVVQYLAAMHKEGRTPSPCAVCNPEVKWRLLFDLAERYQCQRLATGHYIRILQREGRQRLFRAKDRAKDQSYYLWGLGQKVLQKAICPLGEYTKEEVRQIAREIDLAELISEKESTGLCFASHRSYAQILEDNLGKSTLEPGEVVDRQGKKLGTHKGYGYYTIGQKKELNLVEGSEKLCVAEIHAAENLLVADTWQNLYSREFQIGQACFADEDELFSGESIQTRVRGFGLNPEGNTRFDRLGEGSFHVRLDHPAWAVASGQPAVFYSGDKLLGGGIVL